MTLDCWAFWSRNLVAWRHWTKECWGTNRSSSEYYDIARCSHAANSGLIAITQYSRSRNHMIFYSNIWVLPIPIFFHNFLRHKICHHRMLMQRMKRHLHQIKAKVLPSIILQSIMGALVINNKYWLNSFPSLLTYSRYTIQITTIVYKILDETSPFLPPVLSFSFVFSA